MQWISFLAAQYIMDCKKLKQKKTKSFCSVVLTQALMCDSLTQGGGNDVQASVTPMPFKVYFILPDNIGQCLWHWSDIFTSLSDNSWHLRSTDWALTRMNQNTFITCCVHIYTKLIISCTHRLGWNVCQQQIRLQKLENKQLWAKKPPKNNRFSSPMFWKT